MSIPLDATNTENIFCAKILSVKIASGMGPILYDHFYETFLKLHLSVDLTIVPSALQSLFVTLSATSHFRQLNYTFAHNG